MKTLSCFMKDFFYFKIVCNKDNIGFMKTRLYDYFDYCFYNGLPCGPMTFYSIRPRFDKYIILNK